MKRSSKRNQFFASFLTGALLMLAGLPSAAADTLHHKDGTTIRGKIVHETPDQVKIETAYGTLSYQKDDLSKIERDAQAGAAPTPRVNFATVIPAGPVNPGSPPQVPPLVQFAPRRTPVTTATLAGAAAPGGVPTPVAPAVPAGAQAPSATATPASK